MNPTISRHPLDNVMWNALNTVHADLARGHGPARRYLPEFACFAGMPEVSEANLRALAADLRDEEFVAMFQAHDFDPGPWFDVLERKNLVQMIGAATGEVRNPERFRALGAGDVAQMTALAQLTAPGPWFERTSELGRFLGVEQDGRLVAMAGERMRVTGHTEISAVCCHPDWRGRGLAADLVRLVSRAIVARGELPFLHVLASNASAIALYEKLGMRQRLQSRLAVLRRNAVPV